MKIKKYSTNQLDTNSYKFYKVDDNTQIVNSYVFFSIGPKGIFEFRIIFTKDMSEPTLEIYNLAFGVWNSVLNDIDDTIETKNDDMDKILATVGEKAINFILENPTAYLYAKGSTPIRTRKYQIGIFKNLPDIPSNLGIYGIIENSQGDMLVENFKIGINYHAFLLYTK